jgi:hypothetical protein
MCFIVVSMFEDEESARFFIKKDLYSSMRFKFFYYYLHLNHLAITFKMNNRWDDDFFLFISRNLHKNVDKRTKRREGNKYNNKNIVTLLIYSFRSTTTFFLLNIRYTLYVISLVSKNKKIMINI